MLDPLSPIAPARVQVLLLPIGRVTRERFLAFVKRLQPENIVELGDISPDRRPNRNMFSPLAFPTGRIVYDLRTTLPPEPHRALSPFETFREPLAIIGLADADELGHISYEHKPGHQSNRDSLTPEERDLRRLYQELEHLRDDYPKALVHQLLLFDFAQEKSNCKLAEGLVPIPSPSASRTTTIKTVMCDISSLLLAELTTLAKSLQGMSMIESPAQLQNGGNSWSNIQPENIARRNSQFTAPSQDASPSTGTDRSHVRMSMPVRPSLSDSRASSMRPMTPPERSQMPSGSSEAVPGVGSPEQVSPEKKIMKTAREPIGRETSRDRISIHGFGAGSVSERARNKGKGRVAVVIGSLYLHAGRWGDAQRELAEGAVVARANSDHLWHAKALENILTAMLMLAWTGLDFQIPQVCYATAEKAAAPAEQKSSATNRLVSLHNLGILFPELLERILNLYQRAGNFAGESLPQFCFSETVIRFAKLTSVVHLADGNIDDNVLAFIVQGTPFPQLPNTRQPRLNIHPTRTEIATLLFRAFPSFSSKEELTIIDRTIILGGIASVLGSLGFHRKKAMVMRELVSCLIPGLVQARKIGAAEMGVHPAAGLAALNVNDGHNSGAGALDLGEGDVENGIAEFLNMLCRVYGVIGFQSYKDVKSLQNGNGRLAHDDSNEAVIARSLYNAVTRSFGGQDLKMNVLRACINLCEALPDFQGVLKFTTDLLRTAGSGIAPGPRNEDAAPKITREEQVRLSANISRTVGAGGKLGLQHLEAEYWDEFLVRGIELDSLPPLRLPIPRGKAELSGASTLTDPIQKNPFIYNPLLKKPDTAAVDHLLVAGESALFKVKLQNPYDFDIEIKRIRLESEGVQFISEAQSTFIGPYRTQVLNIPGTPVGTGSMVVTGCIIKVRGCRERRFPIFQETWIPQREFKIKTIGLKSTMRMLEQPAPTTLNLRRTFPGVTPPRVSSLKLNVIVRQPLVVVSASTIKQSAIMVLEGERRTFSITLHNVSKDTAVDLLLFSFQDSTQRRTYEAMANKDTSPADLYELELVLSQRQALRWIRDPKTAPYIPPGGTAVFNVEILGKSGLTSGLVQIDYTHLQVPVADTNETFHTRQVSLPLTVTVNSSIELVRIDVLPLAANVPRMLWFKAYSAMSDREEFRSEDYCLLLLDLRNAWPVCLRVQLAMENSGGIAEDILPGNVSRIILPIRRIYIENPHAAIPALDPSRQRQFVVSASRINVETEQLAREAFWYREELLKRVHATWETTSGMLRKGEIELRGLRLGPRMIETLKFEDVEMQMFVENDRDNTAKTQLEIDQFRNFTVRVHNRSVLEIHPLLRLQPSLRNQHHNVTLDIGKRLMWNGVLQRTLPILPPNGVVEVSIGITALCRGEYEINASVEEVHVEDEDGYTVKDVVEKKGRPRRNTDTLMDELLGAKKRRIWYMRTPHVLDVKDKNRR